MRELRIGQKIRDAIVSHLPEGPAYFPDDHLTDQPERFLAGELIREQILRQTRQEAPHAVAVLIERWEESAKITKIAATIYVERDGQKAIVIGAGGASLKKIGTQARLEIEKMLEHKVFLELFVKAEPGWRDSRRFVEELDWRRQLEQRMLAQRAEIVGSADRYRTKTPKG